MPYQDVPAFIGTLRKREAVAASALEFLILTACRTSEVLGARWAEVDLGQRIWTVLAPRMKGARDHRVPLSERAHEILAAMHAAGTSEFVFPGFKPGRPLSNMALRMVLGRRKIQGATVHPFGASFRDWAGDATPLRELAVAALAHVAGEQGSTRLPQRRSAGAAARDDGSRRASVSQWRGQGDPGEDCSLSPCQGELHRFVLV